MTVEGERISRAEIFDEADLDAALARFDEVSHPTPQLENAASRCTSASWTCFAARDWAAMAEILADDICNDDRRRVVNAGVLHGRDAIVAQMRQPPDVGATNITSFVIATRGDRLALSRVRSRQRPASRRIPQPRYSTSSKSTPTSGSWHASRSTPTTSKQPSKSSTPDTSPAKRPPTPTRGQPSRGPTPRSTGAKFPPRRRIG